MRFILLCLLLIGVAIFGFGNKTGNGVPPSTIYAVAAPIPGPDLAAVKVTKFKGRKDGFGNVLIADLTVTNNNAFAIKDVEVTCEHSANSGTRIDKNVRTIYEKINAKSSRSVQQLNMGFIYSQATRTGCSVTDYKIF